MLVQLIAWRRKWAPHGGLAGISGKFVCPLEDRRREGGEEGGERRRREERKKEERGEGGGGERKGRRREERKKEERGEEGGEERGEGRKEERGGGEKRGRRRREEEERGEGRGGGEGSFFLSKRSAARLRVFPSAVVPSNRKLLLVTSLTCPPVHLSSLWPWFPPGVCDFLVEAAWAEPTPPAATPSRPSPVAPPWSFVAVSCLVLLCSFCCVSSRLPGAGIQRPCPTVTPNSNRCSTFYGPARRHPPYLHVLGCCERQIE